MHTAKHVVTLVFKESMVYSLKVCGVWGVFAISGRIWCYIWETFWMVCGVWISLWAVVEVCHARDSLITAQSRAGQPIPYGRSPSSRAPSQLVASSPPLSSGAQAMLSRQIASGFASTYHSEQSRVKERLHLWPTFKRKRDGQSCMNVWAYLRRITFERVYENDH